MVVLGCWMGKRTERKVNLIDEEVVKLKYQIIFKYNSGKIVNGVLLNEKPTADQIRAAVKIHKADGYVLEEVRTIYDDAPKDDEDLDQVTSIRLTHKNVEEAITEYLAKWYVPGKVSKIIYNKDVKGVPKILYHADVEFE